MLDIKEFLNKILLGDCLHLLRLLPDNSVDCITTSPPYWSQRVYMHLEELGMERTPEQFISNLADIFMEAMRVLKPEGSLWVNIGDTYWGGKGKSGSDRKDSRRETPALQSTASAIGLKGWTKPSDGKHPLIKTKDLVGIPWMLAFELRNRGWYLRSENVWFKPNGIPDSVRDRTTRSHEHVFHFTKSKKYWYDAYAIATPYAEKSKTTWGSKRKVKAETALFEKARNWDSTMEEVKPKEWKGKNGEALEPRANKRSIWVEGVRKTTGNHSAVFPENIPLICIEATCPVGGVVLDPFMGDGTTALSAKFTGRNYIGFEINPVSIENAEARLKKELGIFYQL